MKQLGLLLERIENDEFNHFVYLDNEEQNRIEVVYFFKNKFYELIADYKNDDEIFELQKKLNYFFKRYYFRKLDNERA